MGIFAMSYIWEQPNKGNTLYEMAIIKQKSLVEGPTPPPSGTGSPTPDDKVKIKIQDGKDNPGTRETITGVLAKFHVTPSFGGDCVVLSKEDSDKCKAGVKYLIEKQVLVPTDAMKSAKEADEKSAMENGRAEVVKEAIRNLKNKDVQNDLAFAVRCLMNGVWFDGTAPNDQQKQKVEQCQALLKNGKPEEVLALLRNVMSLEERGIISIDPNNSKLYKENNPKTQFTGEVKMPSMFDAEPDDSMWDEMIVNGYGMPIINLGHPAVAKIIKSDNPEEDCPAELKKFKQAVYGDKRLTAVFGEGGISRVVLGKLANLLTLGIAGAAMDAGKRADRIIKELHEKGGHIVHRNLLVVDYDKIVDADPDDDDLKIPVTAYSRSKNAILGSFDIPASALAQFYSAVDPIKSSKIYLEIASTDNDIAKKLTESSDCAGPALMEGPASLAGKVRKIQDKFTKDPATNPEGGKGESIGKLKKDWVDCLNRNGHPPYYVLKAKTANKEVDVISTSATGGVGTSGDKVHMVTMKVGDHKGATFMTPKDIKLYFSA